MDKKKITWLVQVCFVLALFCGAILIGHREGVKKGISVALDTTRELIAQDMKGSGEIAKKEGKTDWFMALNEYAMDLRERLLTLEKSLK